MRSSPRRWLHGSAPFVIIALTACAAPRPNDGFIAIDHAGVAGRLRRACELTKGAAVAGPCSSAEVNATAEGDPSKPSRSEDAESVDALDSTTPDANSADAYGSFEDRSVGEDLGP
jgi:hypothetical protein